jgi:hypothetical protein
MQLFEAACPYADGMVIAPGGSYGDDWGSGGMMHG